MGKLDPDGFETWAGIFSPTYRLDRDRLEIDREEMFEHEQSFALHDADDASVIIETGHLDDTRLVRVQSTGHTVRLDEPDHVTVLLLRRGRMIVGTGQETFSAAPGDLLLFSPNTRTTRVLPDGRAPFEGHCALIRIEAMDAASPTFRGRPIERRFARRASTRRSGGLVRLLDHLFREGSAPSGILGESSRARQAANILVCEMLEALLREAGQHDPGRSRPSPRDHALARQAEELMRERYRDPISTRVVAAVLGVSARRLQVAFENARGTTPLGTLQAIRLEMARERLATTGVTETITTIAIECGFGHLGRFARIYAETFGEMPSDTLRRSRA